MKTNWHGINQLITIRRRPLLWAIIAFIIYFASIIIGSIAQKSIGLDLEMGWTMQLTSILAILMFANFFKKPFELLGLQKPAHKNWLSITLVTAVLIIAYSTVLKFIGNEKGALESLEYYLYQATLPGIGEELGLRGAFFGFLLYFAKQKKSSEKIIWLLIIVQAIPFGIGHILNVSGIDALLIFLNSSVIAIVLAWLRLKTGSIIPCIIAHNLFNIFGSLLFYFLTR